MHLPRGYSTFVCTVLAAKMTSSYWARLADWEACGSHTSHDAVFAIGRWHYCM
jgi:hypothetical protein